MGVSSTVLGTLVTGHGQHCMVSVGVVTMGGGERAMIGLWPVMDTVMGGHTSEAGQGGEDSRQAGREGGRRLPWLLPGGGRQGVP